MSHKTLLSQLNTKCNKLFTYLTQDIENIVLELTVLPDAKIKILTENGAPFLETLGREEYQSLHQWLKNLANHQNTLELLSEDGLGIFAFFLPDETFCARFSLKSQARSSSTLAHQMLSKDFLSYLQVLVALQENIMIVGDSGFEEDLAMALISENQTFINHGLKDTLNLTQGIHVKSEFNFAQSFDLRDKLGLSTLLSSGELHCDDLASMFLKSGIIYCNRASSLEHWLIHSGVSQDSKWAPYLETFSTCVILEKTLDGKAAVFQIVEFQKNADAIVISPLVERKVSDDGTRFVALREPLLKNKLLRHGLVDLLSIFHVPNDLEFNPIKVEPSLNIQEHKQNHLSQERFEPKTSLSDDLENEPGWELDALDNKDSSLISAPGLDGRKGFFRARPVIRAAVQQARSQQEIFDEMHNPPKDDSNKEDEIDEDVFELELDAPPFYEEPSPSYAAAPSYETKPAPKKRAFREILQEHHRYPPVSEDGAPTLTPPIFTGSKNDDDDIPL